MYVIYCLNKGKVKRVYNVGFIHTKSRIKNDTQKQYQQKEIPKTSWNGRNIELGATCFGGGINEKECRNAAN